ncbi:MAG: gluconate 2-dehydrogenase subunit 3 family protein [Gemmatirosa sp.]|nr:gluconate 2-dehydrogenase subunit 3 family protein [Gemmatirosa sp.]
MSRPPAAINRREALRRASLLLGGALSASTIAGVLAGCEGTPAKSATGGAWQPRALSAPQSARVVALAEHILPATDTPGATDAHVVEFIDVMLADYYPAAERARFLAGLDRVDARAQRAFGKAFLDGSSDQQAALVVALDQETFAKPAAPRDPAAEQRNPVTQQGNVATGRGAPNDPGAVGASGGVAANGAPDPEDVAVRSFFRTLKELTLVGYYTSEAGATRELHVNPMGAWKSDVPYETLGRAWA